MILEQINIVFLQVYNSKYEVFVMKIGKIRKVNSIHIRVNELKFCDHIRDLITATEKLQVTRCNLTKGTERRYWSNSTN